MEFLSNIEYKSILGYLPATIIKNVIETKVALTEKLPRHYVTESVGLFSDISGFTKYNGYMASRWFSKFFKKCM